MPKFKVQYPYHIRCNFDIRIRVERKRRFSEPRDSGKNRFLEIILCMRFFHYLSLINYYGWFHLVLFRKMSLCASLDRVWRPSGNVSGNSSRPFLLNISLYDPNFFPSPYIYQNEDEHVSKWSILYNFPLTFSPKLMTEFPHGGLKVKWKRQWSFCHFFDNCNVCFVLVFCMDWTYFHHHYSDPLDYAFICMLLLAKQFDRHSPNVLCLRFLHGALPSTAYLKYYHTLRVQLILYECSNQTNVIWEHFHMAPINSNLILFSFEKLQTKSHHKLISNHFYAQNDHEL